jgi:hypothetical protein
MEQILKKNEVYSKEEAKRKSAEGQIKKAQKLIDEGTDPEELPEALKWTIDSIITPAAKQGTVKTDDNIEDRILNRIKDDNLWEAGQEKLKGVKANKTKWRELQVELQDLVDSGMPRGKALGKAIKITGIEAKATKSTTPGAGLPATGSQAKEVDPLSMSDTDFLKWSKEQEKS